MKRILLFSILFFCLPVAAETPWYDLTKTEIQKMGERIYHTRGANTCLMCHGAQGKGGSIAEAARLDEPRTWKTFQALGGKEELQKNPQKFLQQMQTVDEAIIQYGSIRWNQERKDFHPNIQLDISLDPLMYGIQQAPTLKEINTIRREIKTNKDLRLSKQEMQQLAAHAVFEYIKTFDKGGKKGGVFGKN